MAKRVVVELQMKTIKRYSLQGLVSCLCLLLFVALPIVELFLPFNIVQNATIVSSEISNTFSFTVIDIMKSVFKMDNAEPFAEAGGKLMFYFKSAVGVLPKSQQFYDIFINTLPTLFIVGVAVFFLQCVLAIWALILIIVFLARGRWSFFNASFIFSHFGLWSTFFVVALGNGLIIFATSMGVGGYREMSNAYLVFPFPGWLYTVIYFGVGLIGFLGLFFLYEYGLADRIYIGKNRRPGEPNVSFYNKNNYVNVTEVLTGDDGEATDEVIEQLSDNYKKEEENPAVVDDDKIVGTTVVPQEPKVQPEPESGIPQNIIAIGGHAFSENQNLVKADIPDTIEKLGDAAFSNCLALTTVIIPTTIKSIGSNCFFNCARLTKVNYKGTKAEWKGIKRGSNWLLKAGTKIVHCSDGPVQVNPLH